jgi:hypothetical protein
MTDYISKVNKIFLVHSGMRLSPTLKCSSCTSSWREMILEPSHDIQLSICVSTLNKWC